MTLTSVIVLRALMGRGHVGQRQRIRKPREYRTQRSARIVGERVVRVPVLHEPAHAELEFVGQRDLRDGGVDEDLGGHHIEASDEPQNAAIIGGRRLNENRVLALVDGDLYARLLSLFVCRLAGRRAAEIAGREALGDAALRRAGTALPAHHLRERRIRLLPRPRKAARLRAAGLNAGFAGLRRHGSGRARAGARHLVREHRLEHIDQFLRPAVLDEVGIELLFAALGARIEPSRPRFGASQVFRLGRNDQDGAQLLVRDEPHHSGHRPFPVRGEHALQLVGDDIGLRGLDRHQRERHPLHHVDVEDGNRVEHAGDVLAVPRQRDGVARIVDLDDPAARGDRRQNAVDLGCGDIFELDHLDPRPQPLAGVRRPAHHQARAHRRLVDRDDLVRAAGVDDDDAVGIERGLEKLDHLGFRHRLRRLDRHLALDRRVDGVFHREEIAEDGLRRLGNRHVDEVERHPVTIFRHRARRAGLLFADEPARTDQERCLLFGRDQRLGDARGGCGTPCVVDPGIRPIP